jgi:hypothetical protein
VKKLHCIKTVDIFGNRWGAILVMIYGEDSQNLVPIGKNAWTA